MPREGLWIVYRDVFEHALGETLSDVSRDEGPGLQRALRNRR